MTIRSVETLGQLASTVVATYGTLTVGNDDDLKASLISGNANFVSTQADTFVARYKVLNQLPNVAFNGFSAAVFEDKQTGKHVLAMRGTEVPVFPSQTVLDLLKEDGLSIGGNGFANTQAVEMIRYYRRLTTAGGQAVQYTEQEKWQLFAVKNSLLVPLAAVLPSLTPALVAAFVAFKQDLAADKGVLPPAGSTSTSVLSPSEKVDVTGHSLGGHLAILFARFFPDNVDQVVTLNAPGLFPQGDFALTEIGYPPPDNSRITRIEADGDGISEIGMIWPGYRIRIAQENEAGAVAAISSNHSSVNGNDSLALMSLLSRLDTRFANDAVAISAVMRGAANVASKTYENALDGVRKLLLGAATTGTTVSAGASDLNRGALYDNMMALMATAAFQALVGKVRIDPSSADLKGKARNDFGALLSLITLSPVVLTGLDSTLGITLQTAWGGTYTDWQTDKSLSQADRDAGKATYTDRWMGDRGALLSYLMEQNTKNYTTEVLRTPSFGGNAYWYEYVDAQGVKQRMNVVDQGVLGAAGDEKRIRVSFGSGANDFLVGGKLNDHLYGGAGLDQINAGDGDDYVEGNADFDSLYGEKGRDTLLGGAGGDWLEGGAGSDSLLGGDGLDKLIGGADSDFLDGGKGHDTYTFDGDFGHDAIDDLDGDGEIWINGAKFNGGTWVGDGVYKDSATGWSYARVAGDLLISKTGESGQITVRHWGESANVGITLTGSAPPAPPPTLTGDFEKALNGNDFGLDANSNFRSTGAAAPNAQDLIGGTLDGDVIAGLGGNDQLSGFDGDDRLEGGEGDDVLNGGAGRDTLLGGAGIDFIFGSARGTLYRPWGPNSPGPESPNTEDTRGLNWVTLGRSIVAPAVPGAGTGWINIDWVDADGEDLGNLIDGGAGHDVIYAGRGNDVAHGGDDADEMHGQGADDTLYGDAGNDTIEGDQTSNPAYENAMDASQHGDDVLDGGAGNDSMYGNGGQDTLYGGLGDDRLLGDDNNIDDTPLSIQDDDYLDGGEGNDTMAGNGGDDELFGGSGNDELSGDDTSLQLTGSSHGNDYLDGEDGNDAMNGGGRDDELFGGAGNDTMWGDVGSGSADAAYSGNDYLDGETGDDWISGGGRDDQLFGGAGNDSLFGDTGASVDEVPGSYQGNDYLDGEDGNDQLVGNGGADTLFGGAGNDLVFGDAQAELTPDALHGADYLDGGDGADTLLGGGGNDTLVGGAGLDYLDGGAGDDTYILTAADTTLVRQDIGGGVVVSLADAIVDTQGRNKYVLQGVGEVSVIAQASGELVLNFGDGNNSGVIVSNGLRGAIASVDVDGTVQSFSDWIATHLLDSVGVAGQGGDEEISTGRGNDTVSGGGGRDTIASAGGDDHLEAGDGDDVLQGGTGNDTLDGGRGDDTYLVNAGDGHDVLLDAAGNDRIVFGAGITPGQIGAHLEPDAADLAVQHFVLDVDADTSLDFGPLGAAGAVPSLIKSLQFADGNVWTPADLQSVLSNAHGSLLTGTTGDDTLAGTILRDTIEGGQGADLMQGGAGDDTYVIHAADSVTAGSALDVIDDSLGHNTLVFDAGTVATATLDAADGSVTLHADAGSSLRLQQGLLNGIETVQVGAVTYRFSDWLQNVLTISAQLTGNPGQTLIGGSGSDTLRAASPYSRVTFIGGRGDDTFTSVSPGSGWFNRYDIGIVLQQGDGHDVLTAGPAFHRSGSESNWLQFGSGISADSLHLVARDPDAWTLQYGTQGDTLRLQHTGYSMTYDYEADFDELRFADGSTMSWAGLLARGVDVIVDAATPSRNGSLGNDRFIGSAADDTLRGLAGNDTLDGGAGDDLLDGGTGDDVYRYALGSGTDRLSDIDGINMLELGAGITAANTRVEMRTFGSPSPQASLMLVFNETDRVVLGFIGMDGSFSWPVQQVRFADGTVWSSQEVASKYFGGTSGNDFIYGLDTSDLIQGGAGADVLEGRNGNDTVLGGEGNDRLSDGNGDDVMSGGAGNDTYITGSGDDVILFSRGDGADMVANGIEHVRFGEGIAPADIAVTRRRSPDTSSSDEGWRAELELLLTIKGAADSVALTDYFRYLDAASSVTTIEFADGTVWDQAALKQLAMTGTAGNDRLFGYATDDLLSGGAGNDELDGALGVDTLVGGTGDDTYTVDGADDVIVELAGEGTDTVKTSVGMTLAGALENGTAIGLNLTLTGNAFDNVLADAAVRSWNTTGNVTLAGGAGNDTYLLGANPTIVVEAANEGIDTEIVDLSSTLDDNVENLVLRGGSSGSGNALDNNIQGNASANFLEGLDGNDSLYGLAGTDELEGGNGNDLLDGGAGRDTMTGGLGDDTYVVDSSTDVVTELAGGGTDTVLSTVTITALATGVENLTLGGSGNLSGTGNATANVLTGNIGNNTLTGAAGNDTLDGGAGNDTLKGGAGDDIYFIDAAGDSITEVAGEGTDTVNSLVSVTTLWGNVENLTLIGSDAISGNGNALDNLLFGNSGANTLTGGSGNDTYYGGAGNDLMNDTVATSNDVYRWGRGDGLDTITDAGGSDRIEIATGITAAQLTQTRSGNNLVLGISGVTADKLTITNWYVGTANKIETIKLADGTTISITVTALSSSAPTEKAMPAVATAWATLDAAMRIAEPAREGLATPLNATESAAVPSAHELAFSSASTRWNDPLSLRRVAA